MAEMVRPESIIKSIRPETRLVVVESPLTKTFELIGLQAVADAAHAVGAVVLIDNSYATPLLQRPMRFGIDMVVYSATKYTGGHSDVVGGILVCDQKRYTEIFKGDYLAFGSIMSPFSAWLFLRGLRTLPVRMKQIAETTKKVLQFFENHTTVERVLYPGSISQDQKTLFELQMDGISGLFSVVFKNKDPQAMENFVNDLRFFQMAVSWGGHESLVLPYALWEQEKNSGMVRFSIGLEEAATLIDDLSSALHHLSS